MVWSISNIICYAYCSITDGALIQHHPLCPGVVVVTASSATLHCIAVCPAGNVARLSEWSPHKMLASPWLTPFHIYLKLVPGLHSHFPCKVGIGSVVMDNPFCVNWPMFREAFGKSKQLKSHSRQMDQQVSIKAAQVHEKWSEENTLQITAIWNSSAKQNSLVQK